MDEGQAMTTRAWTIAMGVVGMMMYAWPVAGWDGRARSAWLSNAVTHYLSDYGDLCVGKWLPVLPGQ